MPRLKRSDILLTALLGCGLGVTAYGTLAGAPAGTCAGAALLAGAGAGALAAMTRLRRRCDAVTRVLNAAANAKFVDPDALAAAAPEDLGPALGEALAAARRGVVDAELHARELEIRLKIADAEREHAQLTLSAMTARAADLGAAAGACAARAATAVEEPQGAVAVLHDVAHQREIAQLKNDFVSNVSHELRTPLASIKAYVELLIDGEAQDEQAKREFYEVIQNDANRLGRLIDDILNISKIESGLATVDRKPQSLTELVKDALEAVGPQAERKQITLSEQLTTASYQALGDRDMLYQALLNLLTNAVKYTPEGGRVTIETAVDGARRKVIARVTDTGVGIPPKELPFIFDKFYRAQPNSRVASGTGLGLSLVKHIVETVHHGRVLVQSQFGKGTCVGFELDLCE